MLLLLFDWFGLVFVSMLRTFVAVDTVPKRTLSVGHTARSDTAFDSCAVSRLFEL